MSAIRYQFLEHDSERVLMERATPKQEKHRIEIVTDGVHKLIYIDGMQLQQVLDVELPLEMGEISPRITITLHPESVEVRKVDSQQFKDMQAAQHPGERIIPPADNKALCEALKASQHATDAAWKAEVLEQLKAMNASIIQVTEGLGVTVVNCVTRRASDLPKEQCHDR